MKLPAATGHAGLAPGAARTNGPQALTNGIGKDEIAIVSGALPALVVEGWGLFRGTFELLQRLGDNPLRGELDAKLVPLREFFTKIRNAAIKHSIHSSLDVLSTLPELPAASPFKDTDAAAMVITMARHEGNGSWSYILQPVISWQSRYNTMCVSSRIL